MSLAFSLALLVSLGHGQSFESWAAKAERAQKKGESPVAIDYWGNALRIWRPAEGKGRRVKALSARSSLYAATGNAEAALSDLDEALKLDPRNAKILDQRGSLHLSGGRLDAAVSDFYAATKAASGYGPAYFHRAQAYDSQGEKLFAAEDFKTACRLGVKEACAASKAAAAAAPPSTRKGGSGGSKPAAETADDAADPPPAGQAHSKPAPVNLAACRAALSACMDRPTSLDICVKKARVCENSPEKGCCPLDCLQLFQRSANDDKSDSELFREIFSPKGSCRDLVRGHVE
jgi:hypothetical protein